MRLPGYPSKGRQASKWLGERFVHFTPPHPIPSTASTGSPGARGVRGVQSKAKGKGQLKTLSFF